MKKKTKIVIIGAVAVAIVTALVLAILSLAGGKLDSVATVSAASLDAVFAAAPTLVTEDAVNGGWSLAAPDGEARFIWSKDFSQSPLHDVMIELDATPFVDAGLDTAKLPVGYSAYGDKLMVGTKYGQAQFTYAGDATPLGSYRQFAALYPDALNYHASLDHFGVKLGNGNMFEWAKDLAKNTATGAVQDKDIVFVLNPEPLIAAGVDPAKVQGWVYAQVEVMENGAKEKVYKFLKPFDIQ